MTTQTEAVQTTGDIRLALLHVAHTYQPAEHDFFRRLKNCPTRVIGTPTTLGEIYLRYQAAMHATRAAAYRIPFLDRLDERKRKISILWDDDNPASDATHHEQLAAMFRDLGAQAVSDNDLYDAVESGTLDPATARFVAAVDQLYPRSLGAWCLVEMLAESWMQALADALAVHFPDIRHAPYFADCFTQGIEVRHGEEALELTVRTLGYRPKERPQTLADANQMGMALNVLWDGLLEYLQSCENNWTE